MEIYIYETLARECVYAEEILGRPTLRAWMFNILGLGGPVPLLLDSTKQWSVAMQVETVLLPSAGRSRMKNILSALLP